MADPPLDSVLAAGVSSQLPEVSREEILRQIFGEVGELIDDFTCAVESTVLIHGRLYVTSKFICFYSNLFGLEKKIRIPYSHIKGITKENTAMVIPNAIAISTDKKSYTFRSFWDRDECHRMLNLFLQRFRSKEPLRGPDSSSSTTSARRGSANLTDAKEVRLFSAAPLPLSDTTTAIVNDNSAETEIEAEPIVRDRRLSAKIIVPQAFPSSEDKERPLSMGGDSSGRRGSRVADPNAEDVMDFESGLRPESVRIDSSKVDWALKYEQELTKVRLKLTVVQDQVLNMTLEEFYKVFLDNDAPMSIKQYHELVNDTNLTLSQWEGGGAQSLGNGRELRFFKPVNLPGLASTRGIKVQRCVRFGDYGIVVCSSTRLEDVPAADTFSVDDVLAVKSIENGKISFEITFQVSFLKSTFMKYIIERSTNTEMTKWLECFANHLKKSADEFRSGALTLTGGSVASTIPKTSESNAAKSTPVVVATLAPATMSESTTSKPISTTGPQPVVQTDSKSSNILVIGLVVLLIVVLVFDLWRWRAIHFQVEDMRSKMAQIESLVNLLEKSRH